MVDITVRFGQAIGPFVLTHTLYSVIQLISSKMPSWKSTIFAGQGTQDVSVLTRGPKGDAFHFKFDPVFQLLRYVAYTLPTTVADTYRLRGSCDLSQRNPPSVHDAVTGFGKPVTFRVGTYRKAKAVYLMYDGCCMVFELQDHGQREIKSLDDLIELKSQLLEIRVLPFSNCKQMKLCSTILSIVDPELSHLGIPGVKCIVCQPTKEVSGLQVSLQRVTCSKGDVPSSTAVLFGDSYQDVLAKLGSPSQVYYKDSTHWQNVPELAGHPIMEPVNSGFFLNYPHLGMDLLLNSEFKGVSKIVLYTNSPRHSEFCSQARCHFKFSLVRDGLAAAVDEARTLIVFPSVNWKAVVAHVSPTSLQLLSKLHYSPSSNSVYPFPDTHLWVLCKQLLVEVTGDNRIARITMVPPSHAALLSVKETAIDSESTQLHRDLRIFEEEMTFETKVRVEDEHMEEGGEEDGEGFHSAESSLVSCDSQEPSNDRHSSLVNRVGDGARKKLREEIRTVSEKVLYGNNVNVVVGDEVAEDTSQYMHASVVYEFPSIALGHPLPAGASATLYESQTLRIYADTEALVDKDERSGGLCGSQMKENDSLAEWSVSGQALDNLSPECDSFDFVSYDDVTEDLRAKDSREVSGEFEARGDGDHVIPPGLSEGESAPPNIEGTTEDDLHPQTSTVQFRYQPTSTDNFSSRVMTLSQDLGVITDPSPLQGTGTTSGRGSHSTVSKRIHFPPGESGGQGGTRLVIQRRAGLSSREEARKRILSHTKSSQQRLRQKYVSKKEAAEISEEEGVAAGEVEEGEQDSSGKVTSDTEEGESRDQEEVREKGAEDELGQDKEREEGEDRRETDMDTRGSLNGKENDKASHQRTNDNFQHLVVVSSDLNGDTSKSLPSTMNSQSPDLPPTNLPLTINQQLLGDAGGLPSSSDSTVAHSPSSLAPVADRSCDLEHSCSSSPHKLWGDEIFTPDFGPSSMTQDRVLMELISCDHDDVCRTLQTRQEGLVHLWNGLVMNPEHVIGSGKLGHMTSHDDALFPNFLSALVKQRSVLSLQVAAVILPTIASLFHSATPHRHLMTACAAVSVIIDEHGSTIQQYKGGHPSSAVHQCQACWEGLKNIAVRVDGLISTLQQSREEETDAGRRGLTRLQTLSSELTKVLREMQIE